jgi:multicomponent Na+:H+ antiporter subunit E
MIKNRIIVFLLGVGIWLMFCWSARPEDIAMAALVGLLVCFLTADMFPSHVAIFNRPVRYLWVLYYLLIFTWECFKANLDGAYRVIHPDLPIRPGIIKVRVSLKSETGLTFLANTLSLKPGTMTIDIDREKGFMYVHCAEVKSQDIDKATEQIVSKFERILKRIFE